MGVSSVETNRALRWNLMMIFMDYHKVCLAGNVELLLRVVAKLREV